MAERVVKYRLSASVAEYEAGMQKAADATDKVADSVDDIAKRQQALDLVGKSLMGIGTAMLIGVGAAIKKAADFNEAMSNVKATGEDAVNNFDALRQAAMDAGAATVFSATEAANAIEEMAKAGVDASDILGGGLQGALDLAAAGGLGVAEASEIAAVALKTFGLEGKDMSHVADLLAAGAGKAMGDVSDLSAALSQGGQVAAATGLSIEETTAALASFASQGLLGSDAGTSLKTMLQRLTPQSKEAKEQFEALGISAYDANGQFVGLSNFAGQLEEKMKDLTPEARNAAMSVMFGSDAVRAANVLYKEGAEGIEEWIEKVNDQGYAAETARTRLDNLKGDLEALGGAFDTLMITMGDNADGPLRALVQMITSIVDKINELPGPIQTAMFWLGAVGGAVALAAGAFFLAVPKVKMYKDALADLGPAAQKSAKIITGALKAIGSVGLFVGVLDLVWQAIDALAGANASAEELEASFKTVGNTAEGMWATVGKGRPELGFVGADLAKIQGAVDKLGGQDWNFFSAFFWEDDLRNTADRLVEVGKNLANVAKTDAPAAARAFQKFAEETDGSEKSIYGLLQLMPDYKSQLIAAATEGGNYSEAMSEAEKQTALVEEAMKSAEPEIDLTAQVTEQMAVNAEAAAEHLSEMQSALMDIAGVAMSTSEAIDQAQTAVNRLGAAADAEGVSIDGINDASIAFRDSMREVEEASRKAASAIIDNGGSTEEATAQWQAGRDAIIAQLEAMGLSRAEAAIWADKNLGASGEVKDALVDLKAAADAVPKTIPIKPTVDTSKAKNDFSYLVREIEDTPITVWARIGGFIGGVTPSSGTGNGNVPVFYAGGMVTANADGNMYGGFASGIYQGVQGGIHKFAESEMGVPWEAYISGRPASRDRNIGIAFDALDRLGVNVGGGSTTVSLAGATFMASIDGRPITMMIQEQVVGAFPSQGAVTSRYA